MPVLSRFGIDELTAKFITPPREWAQRILRNLNQARARLPLVIEVDSTDSSDEYSPSEFDFQGPAPGATESFVLVDHQRLKSEEFTKHFYKYAREVWHRDLSTLGDTIKSGSAAPLRGVSTKEKDLTESPAQVKETRFEEPQDEEHRPSPYITRPTHKNNPPPPPKRTRRSGKDKRHRKKQKKQTEGKMPVDTPEAESSSGGAEPSSSNTQPALVTTTPPRSPSPFPVWRDTPSPPWETVTRCPQYTSQEKSDYRKKQTAVSTPRPVIPLSATRARPSLTVPLPVTQTGPPLIIPSSDSQTWPPLTIPSSYAQTWPPTIPSLYNRGEDLTSVHSEESIEIITERPSMTNPFRAPSKESVKRTPVAPAAAALAPKMESTESSIIDMEAPSKTDTCDALAHAVPTSQMESTASSIIDMEAPSKTDTCNALAHAVPTSQMESTASSIIDMEAPSKTDTCDALAHAVPTSQMESTASSIIDMEAPSKTDTCNALAHAVPTSQMESTASSIIDMEAPSKTDTCDALAHAVPTSQMESTASSIIDMEAPSKTDTCNALAHAVPTSQMESTASSIIDMEAPSKTDTCDALAHAVSTSQMEHTASSIVYAEASPQTETLAAHAPAVLTSEIEHIASSIVDMEARSETETRDALSPAVPTSQIEHTTSSTVHADASSRANTLNARAPAFNTSQMEQAHEGQAAAEEAEAAREERYWVLPTPYDRRRAAAEDEQRHMGEVREWAAQNETGYFSPFAPPTTTDMSSPYYWRIIHDTFVNSRGIPYPYPLQHTPHGIYPRGWEIMSRRGYTCGSNDILGLREQHPNICLYDPHCCQHRHPYGPQTTFGVPPYISCCCVHEPTRCCPCLTPEQQNAGTDPGNAPGEIPEARRGHDWNQIYARWSQDDSGVDFLARRFYYVPVTANGTYIVGRSGAPACCTGFEDHIPGGYTQGVSGEWGYVGQTGYSVPTLPVGAYVQGRVREWRGGPPGHPVPNWQIPVGHTGPVPAYFVRSDFPTGQTPSGYVFAAPPGTPGHNGYSASAGHTGYGAPAGRTGYGAPAGHTGYGAPAGHTAYGAPTGHTAYAAPTGQTGYAAPTGPAGGSYPWNAGDGYNQGSGYQHPPQGPGGHRRFRGSAGYYRSPLSGVSHRHTASPEIYQHIRAGFGPGPSVATTPIRPRQVLRGTSDSWDNLSIPPNLQISPEPVPVRGQTVTEAATGEIAIADEERVQSTPLATGYISPGATIRTNFTSNVSQPTHLSPIPPSALTNASPPLDLSPRLPAPNTVPSASPPIVDMDSPGPPSEELAPSVAVLFDQARKTRSCVFPCRPSPRELPPIPLVRVRHAPILPEQVEPELTNPEKTKPESLLLQNVHMSELAINTPDTPCEFFDAKQEKTFSPVPSEKSDRPTTPELTTGPATGPTTPRGSPKEGCIKDPESKDGSPSRSVGFPEDPCGPADHDVADVSYMHQAEKDIDVHFIVKPVISPSAERLVQKAHRAVVSYSSPFLKAVLAVVRESEDKVTHINVQTGPRFSARTTFGLGLQVLYQWDLVSHENLRLETLKGLGYDPEIEDSALPFSIRSAQIDFALCYAAVGVFFGCTQVVERGIELALDFLDWDSADFLLGFVMHVDEYMITCPEIRAEATHEASEARRISDEHFGHFHLVQAQEIMQAVYKYMAENVKPEFKLYERAQALKIKTRIPSEIWTLPGSSSSNMKLETIRYGDNPSYADQAPKRLDITVLSAMLITLPFHMFMPLIDELKKTSVMTLALMEEVVKRREERRLHALYIRVQRNIKPGVIPQAYLDELAYREFVTFERAEEKNAVTATVHRIWVGFDFPNQAARTARVLTVADLHAPSDPVPGVEAPSAPASSAQVSGTTGKKGKKNRKKKNSNKGN